jgi:hypothetical protein
MIEMKNILNKSLLVGSTFAMLVIGCSKKDLEIEPRQSIRTENTFTSRQNVDAAITGVYAYLKNLRYYGRDMLAVAEAMSENGFATGKSGRLINEAANVPGAHFGNWQVCYYAIAQINMTLAAIPSLNVTPAVTVAERNAWEGQLFFLRALMYHDLMRCYAYEPGLGVPGQDRGGVPLVLSTPTTIEAAVAALPARAPADSVYNQIYRDLDAAIARLTNAGFPAIATQVSAQALYARVALYRGDYTRAAQMASLVLNNAGIFNRLSNVTSYLSTWTSAVNAESLFEIRFANPTENLGVNESLQTSYTTLRDRGNPAVVQGFGDLVGTTTLLLNLGFTGIAANGQGGGFSGRSDDVRNLLFEPGSSARGTVRIECTKFIGKNGIPNLDNIPVIRLPEVLLTRAEARAFATNRNGSPNTAYDSAAARADLVTFKQRRYANYATTQQPADNAIASEAALVTECLRQRRLEYAMEGHRWFDYKRVGGMFTSANVNVKGTLTAGYQDFRILAQIPIREVDGNPNLAQNFGY